LGFSDVFVPGILELETLQEVSEKHGLPVRLIQKLVNAEWQTYGMYRRASIHSTIEKIFDEDWRTLEEVYEEINLKKENIAQ